jgi:hypothetical protein
LNRFAGSFERPTEHQGHRPDCKFYAEAAEMWLQSKANFGHCAQKAT